MTSSTTSNVYIHVIEDVITKVREEFINNGGAGETVLNELQGIWEMKMLQAGAILGPIDRSAAQKATPGTVHDLNVPYEGNEEYETPTADMLFPPTPLPGSAQTPLPGTVQTPLPGSAYTPGTADIFNIPTGGTPITPNDYSPGPGNDAIGIQEGKTGFGRPSPYMQPPTASWSNQRPPLDVNVAYVEGREDGERGAPHQPLTQDLFTMPAGKRKRDDIPSQIHPGGGYIPQQDGSGDSILDSFEGQGNGTQQTTANIEIDVQGIRLSSKIPQLDGPMPDPYDEMLSTPNIYYNQGVANEDYNIVTPAPNDIQAATPAPVIQNEVLDDDDDEPLNENDDDDDVDDGEQSEDINTSHLVLAQFDKVTRTKSRWKCILKDGIMHINNKDILFNKATGEFEF
ncbi:general transcription factor [Lithospermum erythrorhizon]|uniref:General transcription factor n=1 Tax=Lithospermum erythrorhizon TaxID=34254 RepID=A0AAV3PE84_LITER